MNINREETIWDKHFPYAIFTEECVEFTKYWHEVLEIVYVLEGTLKIGLNNEVLTLEQGDLIFFGGGELHYYPLQDIYSKEAILIFDMSIFYPCQEITDFLKMFKPLFVKATYLPEFLDIEGYSSVVNLILKMLQDTIKMEEGFKIAIKSSIYNLILLLFRGNHNLYKPEEKSKNLISVDRLEKVFQYIEKNYSQTITLHQIAKITNFSIYHFTRFFKRLTGMTFERYLNDFRVQRAVFLLLNKKDSITSIALESGFSSIISFNRTFKKLKGCSPTEYKKQQKMIKN